MAELGGGRSSVSKGNTDPGLADCCQMNLDLMLPELFGFVLFFRRRHVSICMQNPSILRTLSATKTYLRTRPIDHFVNSKTVQKWEPV